MALMIPHIPFENSSEGEKAIFNSLQSDLDDNYIVFHSVRWVNSKYKSQGEADFLILHRSLGILVIEVKSGYIRTEGRQWFQMNRTTQIEKEILDPLVQADTSKFKFLELLENQNPPIKDCLLCHAVWYPSIEWKFPMPPHYAAELLFDFNTLGKPQTAIENTFRYWNNRFNKPPLSKTSFDRLKFIIAPEFSSVPSVRTNFENRERQFITLTRDQARLMAFLDEQETAVISGSAGTGKTMLALEKANRLGVKNEEVLFLCYNEALKRHLEENNSIKFVHFKTVYELASQFITYTEDTTLNILTEKLSDYLLDNKKQWNYKHVIIDEAQDFNSFFIEVLQEITEGNFYAFYDKNQSIYQQEELEWANNADCKLTLHTNCRNTKEIARTSARNIGLDSKTFCNSPVKGEQSFIAEYGNVVQGLQLIEKIINHLVRDKKANPEDIVLLTMNDISNSILQLKTSICGRPISKFLAKGKICFNTVDDFKGLEAGYLILVDVNVASYSDKHYRNRLYIGCSRAKQGLFILLNNPVETDFAIAMEAIENKAKIKKNRIAFYHKLAVSELNLNL
ncbi:MAG: AAA family ATPase [Cytophagaceae bacterium]|nr:AAA family ATPase [Cytophagaceae bacterium]